MPSKLLKTLIAKARERFSTSQKAAQWTERRRRSRNGSAPTLSAHRIILQRLKARLQHWPILPALFFLSLCAATEFSADMLYRSQSAMAENSAVHLASDIRSRVESELNKVMYLTSGLASYFEVNYAQLDNDEVEKLHASLYRQAEYIRNIGVVFDYKLRYLYPLQGNEAALGINFKNLPKQLPDVQRVIDTGRGHITPKIKLVQGGEGVIYRSPIFVEGAVVGLLSTVININQLLKSALLGFEHYDLRFAIYDRDDKQSLLWGDETIRALKNSKSLPTNYGWTIQVESKLPAHQNALSISFRSLGVLLALILATGLYTIQRHRSDLLYLSHHDSLTGLPNRRSFDERLELSCARAKRDSGAGFCLLIIDLNEFKPINDRYGHIVGDEVLKTVSQRMLRLTREADLVSRWGGDEFGLLLECQHPSSRQEICSRLAQSILEPMLIRGHELRVKASIGFASAPDDGISAHSLLSIADERMYRQKTNTAETVRSTPGMRLDPQSPNPA